MAILGIDYGEKRIGVAISDDMGLCAFALTTIRRGSKQRDIAVICELVKSRGVELIVVGYPVCLNGSEGVQCRKIKSFAKEVEKATGREVVLWDETLSTWEAWELMEKAGVRKKKRKEVVDSMAAAVILQGFLEARRRKGGGGFS
ncbi:MAG: Holliday junction resolvase RuvX [Syntrophales bacterium]|nr:Holliday junction resolvase RuvX [Syntrophales bacterium]